MAQCCQEKGFYHCGECPELPCELLWSYTCDPEQGDTPHGARVEQCRIWRCGNERKTVMYDEKIRALRHGAPSISSPRRMKPNTTHCTATSSLGRMSTGTALGNRPRFRSARISTTSPIIKAASSAVNSSKGALRAATSAGSCPKTSSFSQRCTASRSKTRR